jgi:RHS repeat-associated protein
MMGRTCPELAQITCTSPAHAAGTVDITVSTGGGTSATSPADQFIFASSAPPTVTGISPPSGSPGGQTTVTITGNNFTGATAVSFGSTAAFSFTVNSATQITAVSPAHLAGVVDITVTTANGTSLASTADKFTFGTPGVLTVVERYIHGDQPDQWFARVDTVVTWMLPDHLGSVRDLMNASGSIIDHVNYDAYGNTVSETNVNLGGRLKFAGGEFDIETGGLGLYHFGARYYDAPIGRWLSEDPKGFGGGDSNLNRYVSNGPTDGTDPSGSDVYLPFNPGDISSSEQSAKQTINNLWSKLQYQVDDLRKKGFKVPDLPTEGLWTNKPGPIGGGYEGQYYRLDLSKLNDDTYRLILANLILNGKDDGDRWFAKVLLAGKPRATMSWSPLTQVVGSMCT